MRYPVVHAHHSTTVDKSTWQRPCIRPFIQHSWQRQYARLCTLAANNTDESNKSLIVTIGVTRSQLEISGKFQSHCRFLVPDNTQKILTEI